jgi:uncharacterized membrane protein
MKDTTKIFHQISYLQYPFQLLGLFFFTRPLLTDFSLFWVDYNKGLVFLGLAFSLATLQDTSKTQNNFSKRIVENPKKSRRFIIMIVVQIFFFMLFGLACMFLFEDKAISELSFGLISISIGLIGVLKSAIEMAEKHQKSIELNE